MPRIIRTRDQIKPDKFRGICRVGPNSDISESGFYLVSNLSFFFQSKERSKAMKKRSKKIKTRMNSRAAEFEASLGQPNAKIIDAPNKAKIGKGIRDVDKLLGSQGKGSWPDSSVSILER